VSEGADIPTGQVPVPAEARLLLVYGGTFDPPHRAHVELPSLARDAIKADWLLYVPAGEGGAPLRGETPGFSARERLEMLRAALRGRSRVSISTIEIDRPAQEGPCYTVDTVRKLRAALPAHTAMRLLIGADQAAQFHRWREARTLIELAEPVVMLRAPVETWEKLAGAMRSTGGFWSDSELQQWGGRTIELPLMDISATRVRELLVRGQDGAAELRKLVPEPVVDFIRNRRR